jgi:hypothetical protein
MKLIIKPDNSNKKLESIYIKKYIKTIEPIKIKYIYYKENLNIEILKIFNEKPDLCFIIFNNNKILNIKKIPKFPIFIKNNFYLTPLMILELNGFIKDNNKDNIIQDFIQRIKLIFGCIITEKNFKFKNIDNFNIDSGIKDYLNDFNKLWFVNNVPKWMTFNIPINKAGWFSQDNKYAIDYIFKNFDIKNVAELGCYYGLSSKYIVKKINKQNNIYCFDNFNSIFKTKYCISEISPLDTQYFFKYLKFESFHSKLSDFNNVYTIKLNCFDAPQLLYKYNIKIDLFYIDFCKIDHLLIKFIKLIFSLFPDCIIIGDDAVMLNQSLKLFNDIYNFILLDNCYICTLNKRLIKKKKLLKRVKMYNYKINNDNIEEIKNYNIHFKINYIKKRINEKTDIDKILEYCKILNVEPNKRSKFIFQHGNLYHYIFREYRKDKEYFLDLYNKLKDIYSDNNKKNNFNLKPIDYLNFNITNFI